MPPTRPTVPPNCDVWLGLRCVDKSQPGKTVWTMTPRPEMEGRTGSVQGGFVSALADTAMAASAVTGTTQRVFVANSDMSISFISPAYSGQELRCTAAVIGGNDHASFVEATVNGPGAVLVAKASSTYVLTPRT